jgi:hypothetical protein
MVASAIALAIGGAVAAYGEVGADPLNMFAKPSIGDPLFSNATKSFKLSGPVLLLLIVYCLAQQVGNCSASNRIGLGKLANAMGNLLSHRVRRNLMSTDNKQRALQLAADNLSPTDMSEEYRLLRILYQSTLSHLTYLKAVWNFKNSPKPLLLLESRKFHNNRSLIR